MPVNIFEFISIQRSQGIELDYEESKSRPGPEYQHLHARIAPHLNGWRMKLSSRARSS